MCGVCVCVPDSRVFGVADGSELLGEEGVHLAVDGHQLAQGLRCPQPHSTAGVLEGLQEGGLKLGQEGLQGNPNLFERPTPKITAEVESRATVHYRHENK